MVVGLTGAPGAGKGEAARFLAAWGQARGWRVAHLSFSDQIKEELRSRGVEDGAFTRELLTETATRMREAEGPGVLAARIVRRIRREAAPAEMYIVEAIRHVREIETLREAFGGRFAALAVEAGEEVTAQRLLSRARPDESREALAGREGARRMVAREMGGMKGEFAFNIAECVRMADGRVRNEGTLEELRGAVAGWVEGVAERLGATGSDRRGGKDGRTERNTKGGASGRRPAADDGCP